MRAMHQDDVEQVVGDDKHGEGGQGADGDDEEEEKVVIFLGCYHLSPQLSTLQTVMVLAHFFVILAAGVSYLAWRQTLQMQVNPLPLADLVWLAGLTVQQAHLVKDVHQYLSHTLYLTTICLTFYWIVYGLFASCKAGSPCSTWSLVVGLPLAIFLVLCQLLAAAAVIRAQLLMSGKHQLKEQEEEHHHTTKAAQQVALFFLTWGPLLAASFISSALVQTLGMLLPFILLQLPHQPNRGKSVGCILVSSMASVHRGGGSVTSPWAVEEPEPHPRLAWADFLSGGVSIYQQDEEKEGMEHEEFEERDEGEIEEFDEEGDRENLPLTPLPHSTQMVPPTVTK